MNDTVLSIPVGFHHGQVLKHLAYMHANGPVVITELVQNLLDAHATRGRIIIDAQSETITALDDGRGASLAEMKKKFSEIGNSQKNGDADAIGKKGVGGLSAYVAARTWEFTTREKSNPKDFYRVYVLDSNQFNQASGIQVSVTERPDIQSFGNNRLGAPATTQVVLRETDPTIIQQLIVGRDELARSIQMSFNDKLKKVRTQLIIDCKCLDGTWHKVEVKPREFRGTAQDSIRVETEFGVVNFTLFLNPKPVRDPAVRISYTDPADGKRYGFPISLITTGRTKTSPETKQFFERGYFEGTVSVNFGSMTPDRLGFIDNAQYKAFVKTVDGVVGSTLIDVLRKIESDQQDDKLRQVGDRVLGKFKTYLENHPEMKSQISGKMSALFGGQNSPETPASFMKLSSSPKKKKSLEDKAPASTLVKEAHEKKVTDATRAPRKVSPNAGVGIAFVYPGDEESFNWKWRIKSGVVEFNCAEDRFVTASGKSPVFLEEYCTIMLMAVVTEVVQPASMMHDSKFLELWFDMQLQK